MSYDPSLATDTDKARALLGDTNDSSELFDDDHYASVLALYTPFQQAVAFLADELVARFAQNPTSVSLPSGLSVSWSERVKQWAALAERMRSDARVAASGLSFVPANYGDSSADEFGRPPSYWTAL